jgi:eukaryotic-like serine/threonine-protein kinase
MDDRHWQRLSALFEAGLDIDPAQRTDWIRAECADDKELADELARMLSADSDAESAAFLENPVQTPRPDLFNESDEAVKDYAPGSRKFGAYRLLRLIGQGGMGEVHLAERDDGEFEQRVALKLLPHPTPGLIQRFRQERQILARLEHPNIARLFDGGIGEHGIPYFAMEYVDGQPINQYVRNNKLDISTTLQIFLRVCDAVRYAHRNLVVHRDLKPSNILITPEAIPKLLDFGIAKVLQTTGEEASRTITRVFTPDYAAPEQIRGEAITTATDVYALGVILYELLTGTRPYRLAGRDITLEQAIATIEPELPSIALARVAGNSAQRRKQLRGDLDRIVLTALAKEPEQRYSSAEALSADLRAWLDGRPIVARGDSAWYRMRKFMRRNRVGVAAASIVLIALVAATCISLWQAKRAQDAAQRAETKSRTAEAVKEYLLSVFSSANPYKTDGKTVTARDLLEGGLNQVDKKLAGQPQVQAEIYAAFVETFVELDQLALADRAGHLALNTYRQFLPDDAIEVLRIEQELAQVQLWSTHMDGLAEKFQALLTRIGDRDGRDGSYSELRGDTLAMLSLTYYRSGKLDKAAEVGSDTVTAMRKLHTKYDYNTGLALYQLALIRMAQGRANDVASLISEFVPGDRTLVGPEHPGLTSDVTVIARYLHSIGRLRESRELLDAAVAARLHQFNETHSFVLRTRALLASVQLDMGESDQVERTLAQIIQTASDVPNFAADDLTAMKLDHARALISLNRLDEAHTTLVSAHESISPLAAENAPVPLAIAAAQADIDRREGDASSAAAKLNSIIQVQRQRNDRELPVSLLAYARAESALHNPASAEQALEHAIQILKQSGRPASAIAREIELEWAALSSENNASVSEHLARAAEISCINFGCADPRVIDLIRRAALADSKTGKPTTIAKLEDRVAQFDLAQRKPEEDLSAIATDILAKANAAAVASKH